ncbi:hypothetical protein [Microbacterium sp. Root180]|uniref:hypothetical protein n=1 Tax=Microbacterium sp. Root180 TaxID=1736483 RepID=UPI0006F8F2DA|nr:hypothetical protein [Microbacterium sp. Root180]KRB36868.1 hypothetical protein ASD93_12650 [Microbacterium sp. Root180]
MTGSQVVEIVVRGRLGHDLVAALDDFAVEEAPEGCTRVVGTIPDQARLIGLLEMLDQLHIEVVSVNPVPAREAL